MQLTSQIADQLVAFVRGGASGPLAAAALDIAVEIYNNWLTSDPAFAGRIEHTAEARLLALRLRMQRRLQRGTGRNSSWKLQTLRRGESIHVVKQT
jgi:hypothetical protein